MESSFLFRIMARKRFSDGIYGPPRFQIKWKTFQMPLIVAGSNTNLSGRLACNTSIYCQTGSDLFFKMSQWG